MAPRVLLAEDNESLARALAQFLADQGIAAASATTGEEAEQLLYAQQFDLLVLDLKLPVLSGVDLLRKLRSSPRFAALPVIIISGVYKGDRYVAAARRLGVSHYLEKPFSRNAFLDAVRASLPAQATQPAPLFTLLADVCHGRKSGMLLLPGGLQISLLNGEAVSFGAKGRRDFPSYLVARGKIGLSMVREFVEADAERLFFTEAGLLTYDELAEESRLFLVKSLAEALATDSPARFEAAPPATEPPLVPVSIPRLLYEACKDKEGRRDSKSFIARFGRLYPARTTFFFRRANLVTMHREDIMLLRLVDGKRPLAEVLGGGGMPLQNAAFFQFLLSLRMISFHESPVAEAVPDFSQKNLFNRPLEEFQSEPEDIMGFDDLVEEVADTVQLVVGEEGMGAPLSSHEIDFEQAVQRDYAFIKDKNYYELFGLSPSNFSFNILKGTYFEKTRQYSPERFMELSGTALDLAQEVLSSYANAYSTLSSVVAKERYDEMLNDGVTTGLDGKQDDKLQARIQFQSGSVFLEMGEYENAEKALQDAYALEPDNPRHTAMYAWAIYRNPANKNSRSAIEKARSLLGKSLVSGKSAEAFAFRGWMLLEEGREGLAEGEFLKALKVNPREGNARNGLKLIEERREAEKKGLFRRIFR